MMTAFMMKVNFNTCSPYLNLNFKNNIRYSIINIRGRRGGYEIKLSFRLPFSNSMMAVCVPQPGHSIPNRLLYRHGKVWFSSQKMNCCHIEEFLCKSKIIINSLLVIIFSAQVLQNN